MFVQVLKLCATKFAPLAVRSADKLTRFAHEVAHGPITGGLDDIVASPSLFSGAIKQYTRVIANNNAARVSARRAFSTGRLHP